jgi:hypothetical protein
MLPLPRPVPSQTVSEDTARIQVRSVTGSSYTLVETTTFERLDRGGVGTTVMRPVARSYRTAYACLPVVRNEDDSFTIVDTRTRLVRVSS